MNSPLMAEAAEYRILAKQLVEEHGLDSEDQAFLDTIDGANDIMDQLATLMRKSNDYSRWWHVNKMTIQELADRNADLESKMIKLRRIVIYYMGLIGRKRIEQPDFAYTLANGKPTLVGDVDPADLPDKFVRIKREVNRQAIFAALKEGQAVEGFSISNGSPHLRSI